MLQLILFYLYCDYYKLFFFFVDYKYFFSYQSFSYIYIFGFWKTKVKKLSARMFMLCPPSECLYYWHNWLNTSVQLLELQFVIKQKSQTHFMKYWSLHIHLRKYSVIHHWICYQATSVFGKIHHMPSVSSNLLRTNYDH